MLDHYKALMNAEMAAEKVVAKSQTILPIMARLCLVSTFLEDGLRMISQWSEQQDYVNQAWNLGRFLSFLFVLFNAVGQLGSVVLVLARVKVASACFSLFAVIASQTVAYSILWDFQFLFRNLALTGALLLVVAESRVVGKSLSYGVPSLGTDNAKTALQLAGRILLVFMFLTLLRFELHLGQMIQNLVGAGLILLVAIGYKTKLSSLLLVTWLNAINLTFNAWWLVPVNKPLRDFLKFDFFQTLSVVGGLLMVVTVGPGSGSVDERKKNW